MRFQPGNMHKFGSVCYFLYDYCTDNWNSLDLFWETFPNKLPPFLMMWIHQLQSGSSCTIRFQHLASKTTNEICSKQSTSQLVFAPQWPTISSQTAQCQHLHLSLSEFRQPAAHTLAHDLWIVSCSTTWHCQELFFIFNDQKKVAQCGCLDWRQTDSTSHRVYSSNPGIFQTYSQNFPNPFIREVIFSRSFCRDGFWGSAFSSLCLPTIDSLYSSYSNLLKGFFSEAELGNGKWNFSWAFRYAKSCRIHHIATSPTFVQRASKPFQVEGQCTFHRCLHGIRPKCTAKKMHLPFSLYSAQSHPNIHARISKRYRKL